MSTPVLTPEQVSDICDRWAGPKWRTARQSSIAGTDVGLLSDSHEALRTQLEAHQTILRELGARLAEGRHDEHSGEWCLAELTRLKAAHLPEQEQK